MADLSLESLLQINKDGIRNKPYLEREIAKTLWRKHSIALLSQTSKVEEKNVSLVFWFVAQEPRYGHFIFWSLGNKVCDIVKW